MLRRPIRFHFHSNIRPGHELVAGYSSGFERMQAVAKLQSADHESWSKVLAANLPNAPGNLKNQPRGSVVENKEPLTCVQSQQEAM